MELAAKIYIIEKALALLGLLACAIFLVWASRK